MVVDGQSSQHRLPFVYASAGYRCLERDNARSSDACDGQEGWMLAVVPTVLRFSCDGKCTPGVLITVCVCVCLMRARYQFVLREVELSVCHIFMAQLAVPI